MFSAPRFCSLLRRVPVDSRTACVGIGLGAGCCVWGTTRWTSCEANPAGLRFVVVGGGVVGASTAYSLARRGHAVTLIDSAEPFRSSWGETRISRLSQETPLMLALMKRARELWTQLEEDAGMQLLKRIGTVDIGLPEELKPVLDTFDAGGVPYEKMDAQDLAKRYPQIRLGEGQVAVYQADAWLMLAEKCIEKLTESAARFGARVLTGHSLQSCDTKKRVVTTVEGEDIEYDRLILCCGPWTNQVLKRSGLSQLPLVVSVEQVNYFEAMPGQEGQHNWDSLPLILSGDRSPGGDVYAVPHVVGGVNGMKVGVHREGVLMNNDEHQIPAGTHVAFRPDYQPASEFPVGAEDFMTQAAIRWVKRHLPGLRPEVVHYHRCPYTNVANDDGGFVVGPHPSQKDVILACAFNGEGFKFGTVTGEMAANLALGLPASVPEALEPFDPARLIQKSA